MKSPEIERALEVLERHGLAKPKTITTGTKPKEIWRYVKKENT
jgi:hypothetical protein